MRGSLSRLPEAVSTSGQIAASAQNGGLLRRRPVNGFTKGPSIMQLISYLIVTLMLLVYTFGMLPIFSLPVQIILSLLYYLSLITLSIVAFWCTVFDPTDKQVILQTNARLNGQEIHSNEMEFYCSSCVAYVQSTSKHCKSCNRCVADFDHHCKWLNNCIGKENYKSFLSLVTLLLVNTAVFTLSGILALSKLYQIEDSSPSRTSNSNDYKSNDALNAPEINLEDAPFYFMFGSTSLTISVWKVINIVFVSISGLILFFDANLFAFHMYISSKKITTYDYIMEQRTRKMKEIEESTRRKDEEEKKELKSDKKHSSVQHRNSIESINQVQQQNENPPESLISPSNHELPQHQQEQFDPKLQKANTLVSIKPSKGSIIVRFCCPCLSSKQVTNKNTNELSSEKLATNLHHAHDDIISKIDGKSDATGENNGRMQRNRIDKFTVFNQMDRRGICHTIDLVDNVQMTPTQLHLASPHEGSQQNAIYETGDAIIDPPQLDRLSTQFKGRQIPILNLNEQSPVAVDAMYTRTNDQFLRMSSSESSKSFRGGESEPIHTSSTSKVTNNLLGTSSNGNPNTLLVKE